MQVSSSIVWGLLAVLRDRGVAQESVLAEAGLDARMLDAQTVDVSVVYRAVQAGYRVSQDPALALALGSHAPTHTLSVVGEVLLRCRTIRGAITEIERYVSLLAPFVRFQLIEEGERARLIYEPPLGDRHLVRFATELASSFVVRIGHHFVSDRATPIEMRFAYPAPRYAQAYQEVFGCPVRFDCARNENVFARDILDEQQPFVDDAVCRLLKSRADELLSRRAGRERVYERAKDVLCTLPDLADIDPERVAVRLGTTPSTLRRKLRVEGRSWSELLDEARRELAFRELSNVDIPIKQISERAGFSEPSAFHRAFRRWTGITPARYRAEAVGAALLSA